jgi:hypothetical protein
MQRRTVTLEQLIPVLQVAIGPVILISGVGLLVLSMTNRLGRVIDRSRILIDVRRRGAPQDVIRAELQLNILWRRASLLRIAISLASISVLLDALMMILLFLGSLIDLPVAVEVTIAFAACMTALIGSILYFLRDINLSLRALSHEMQPDAVTEVEVLEKR